MIDWQETTAIGTLALAVSSLAAIAYAGKQLHHERQYRQVANLERQLTFFLSEGFLSARRKLAEDRLQEGKLKAFNAGDPPLSVFEVLDFYEHLGLLIKKNHIDVYDVWHTFYEWLQPVYSDVRTLIEDENNEWADHYSDLRKMMSRMDGIQRSRMRRRNRNSHRKLWTEERIIEHYNYEIEVGGRPRRIRATAKVQPA
jgi:hypothetical protein